MNWFRNLFVDKKQEEIAVSDIAIRVAEIKSRIETFKKNYPWSNRDLINTTTPESVIPKEIPKSNADALKAKLLGKKL